GQDAPAGGHVDEAGDIVGNRVFSLGRVVHALLEVVARGKAELGDAIGLGRAVTDRADHDVLYVAAHPGVVAAGQGRVPGQPVVGELLVAQRPKPPDEHDPLDAGRGGLPLDPLVDRVALDWQVVEPAGRRVPDAHDRGDGRT